MLVAYWLSLPAADAPTAAASPRVPRSALGAAVSLAGAALFRQTNAVWAVFIAGATAVEWLEALPASAAAANDEDDELLALPALALAYSAKASAHRAALVRPSGAGLAWLLLPPLGFAAFVVACNDGALVLGDKANHAASAVHGAQLAYLAAACAAALPPIGAASDGALLEVGERRAPPVLSPRVARPRALDTEAITLRSALAPARPRAPRRPKAERDPPVRELGASAARARLPGVGAPRADARGRVGVRGRAAIGRAREGLARAPVPRR